MKGKDLKQIMDRLELTQQGLADQLGVARNTVNRWANDLEAIPDVIEIAVKSLKLSAKKEKTMPLDLRKRKPVVCPTAGSNFLMNYQRRILDRPYSAVADATVRSITSQAAQSCSVTKMG